MKISTRKYTWMMVSCAFAVLSGAPAHADDTELLLMNPNPAASPKPNVMFILDTSGSMTTQQSTIEPYDSTITYAGNCRSDALYWTDVGITPGCDATNTQWFYKTQYHCAFSDMQIAGIGSYTDTMVMYRPDDPTNNTKWRWQTFYPGLVDDTAHFVECLADSGVHGQKNSVDEFVKVYARRGTDKPDAFTNKAKDEVSWGSAPANISYSVFDGNYLNWKNQPNNITLSRTAIMKTVAKKVLSSVNDLNVGLMRFNPTGPNDERGVGGAVILDLTDLDANRQAVLDAIDTLPADGWTPLSETMYESALYWQGLAADYGAVAWAPTDPNALASTSPMTYQIPEWDVCGKNYNVLLTDGAPTEDTDTPGRIGNLPNFSTTLGYAGCDGTAGDGQCLDDVAGYLSKYDLDPNTAGDQFVTTHTIGFTVDLPLLSETAADAGGEYFLADDVESLTKTLLSIIANINDLSLSFSAPAVSVNTFNRTQNLNDVYITTFGAKANAHWPGNLKKYRITDRKIVDQYGADAVDPMTGFFADTAKSFWTSGVADGNDVRRGGAAQQLPDPLVRNLYTDKAGSDLTAAANALTPSNAAAFTLADFGLTGSSAEPTIDELIRWARGEDLRDEDNNTSTTVRKAMGDPLHSQPAAVVYGGTAQSPDVVIYTATNDGYLHAIDGATGTELWSYIPGELLGNLTRLFFDPRSKFKQYGLDGNVVPVVKDVDQDGIVEPADGDFVQLVFGMRRGGNTFFSLDVTDRYAPQLLWTANLPSFGESWSAPVVAKIEIGTVSQNADDAVIVIGGGYDTVHDTSAQPSTPDAAGASVHFLDLRTGVELWHASADPAADLSLASMTRAFPNEMRVIDLSGDGLADRMYGTDLGGQVWRFDITNGQDPANLVAGGVIAQLGAEGMASPAAADTRRFYNAPDVSLIVDKQQQRRFIAIGIGSGYRAHPFDLTAADRFFSLRDDAVFQQLTQADYDSYPIITDADLVEVSGQTKTIVTPNDRGWKFTLPPNEKILADSLTFGDQVFFVSFTPDSLSAATCSAGKGTNFLYRVSAINGDPIVPDIDAVVPGQEDNARKTTLQQGGIAPSPTILFPTPADNCQGDACKQPPLGCVGVECFDPGFKNNPVRTLWTQDGIE